MGYQGKAGQAHGKRGCGISLFWLQEEGEQAGL
jgi:hypothetical protein